MKYKYQKKQIFGKKLKVPEDILNKVYNCTLSFNEFIEYGLDDKIPTFCLIDTDKAIVEKFGIEKAKIFDWELLNNIRSRLNADDMERLMEVELSVEDINLRFYEIAKDLISPSAYSSRMREVYSDRLFDLSQDSDDQFIDDKKRFNNGAVSLKEIVDNWSLYKDKDLSYCLSNDPNNTGNIKSHELKQFMNAYGVISKLLCNINSANIYEIISGLRNLDYRSRHEYIKQFTDAFLKGKHDAGEKVVLSDAEYNVLFRYSSIEEFLRMFYEYNSKEIIEELKTLPPDYVFKMSIPFSVLFNYEVLSFINRYGLENVVNFNKKCGNFFTNNGCKMLKSMYDMYLKYAGNVLEPNKTIYTKKLRDENGNYIDRPYTKDEFYEAMRRMLIYGPTNSAYIDEAPDYRDITGEFRVNNADLFIDEQAPEELKKAFYTKSITPTMLLKSPAFLRFLEGKNLEAIPAYREKLLANNVISSVGCKIILELLEYNSGASSILVDALSSGDGLIVQWIKYVEKLPIYDKKILHFAVLSYANSKQLIETLVVGNVKLNDKQLQNLSEILVQRNKYMVRDLTSLTDYQDYRNSVLKGEMGSNEVAHVKDSILEILFNASYSETLNIFKVYGLKSLEFIEILRDKEVISVEDKASLIIIQEILDTNDVDELRVKFNEITKLGEIRSLFELENRIKKYFGHELKSSLFKADGKEQTGVSYSQVAGIDVPGMKNIYGQPISSDNIIQVVNLEGIDFNLIIHKLHNFDSKFSGFARKIIEDPSMWNNLEGASTLSTSLISNQHMLCVGHGSEDAVYYGFNDISDNSLMLMGRSDIYVEHGGRKLEPTSNSNEFMIPDVLQMCSISYNEIALDRKSGESLAFDHRLQPNCIICFDGKINDESKRAAQYFNIPIYMVHQQIYGQKNQMVMQQYQNGEIDTFGLEDAKKILYSKIGVLEDRYKLFLNLADKALEKSLIDGNEYTQILEEGRRLIIYYSTQNSIDNIDLNEITRRVNYVEQFKKLEEVTSYEGPKK